MCFTRHEHGVTLETSGSTERAQRSTWRHVGTAAPGAPACALRWGSKQHRAAVQGARHLRARQQQVQVHARQQRGELQQHRPLARLPRRACRPPPRAAASGPCKPAGPETSTMACYTHTARPGEHKTRHYNEVHMTLAHTAQPGPGQHSKRWHAHPPMLCPHPHNPSEPVQNPSQHLATSATALPQHLKLQPSPQAVAPRQCTVMQAPSASRPRPRGCRSSQRRARNSVSGTCSSSAAQLHTRALTSLRHRPAPAAESPASWCKTGDSQCARPPDTRVQSKHAGKTPAEVHTHVCIDMLRSCSCTAPCQLYERPARLLP